MLSKFIKKNNVVNIVDALKYIAHGYDFSSFKEIKVGNFLTLSNFDDIPSKKKVAKWKLKSECFNLISMTCKSLRKEIKLLDSGDIEVLTYTYSDTLLNVSQIVSEQKLDMNEEVFEKIMYVLSNINEKVNEIKEENKKAALSKLDIEIDYVDVQKDKFHIE